MELGKDTYVNGQKIYELKDNQLTFYYKDGKLKARDLSRMACCRVNGHFTGQPDNYGK